MRFPWASHDYEVSLGETVHASGVFSIRKMKFQFVNHATCEKKHASSLSCGNLSNIIRGPEFVFLFFRRQILNEAIFMALIFQLQIFDSQPKFESLSRAIYFTECVWSARYLRDVSCGRRSFV